MRSDPSNHSARFASLHKFGILLGFAALVANGCTTLPSVVAGQIRQRLPTLLGPADSYDVRVGCTIFDLPRGKINWVHVHGVNVLLAPGMRVYDLVADAFDIHADPSTNALKSVGKTQFGVEINQADLDEYLRTSDPVSFDSGTRVVLRAHDIEYHDTIHVVTVFGKRLGVPYAIDGSLRAEKANPSRLDFVPSAASLIRVKLPLALVRTAVQQRNPVVDLSGMKFATTIQDATVAGNVLTVTGSVDLTPIVGQAQQVEPVQAQTPVSN
jgi:hypothetical protein